VAALAFDGTAVFGDVQETTFRYQLDTLSLRLTEDGVAALVPDTIEGVTLLDGVLLADLRADLLEAYAHLFPLLVAGEAAAARALPAYEDFRAKLLWLYERLSSAPELGPAVARPWLASWLAGYSEAEAHALVTAAVETASASPPARVAWRTATSGAAGRLSVTFTAGLCAQPELRDLMNGLARAGVEVHLVSSSSDIALEAAARRLHYPVEPPAIHGLALETEEGRITVTQTGRRSELPAPPILAAGSRAEDLPLLTDHPETEVRLVVTGDAEVRASLEGAGGEALTLFQGREESTCRFHPGAESIPLSD